MSKAIVYAGSSSLGGAAAGAILGAAGGTASRETRTGLATLTTVLGLGLGIVGTSGRHLRLPQVDRETPQRWLNAGPWRWAALNGVTLGVGAFNRIGFWLWYAVPLGSLLLGRPLGGALIYGTYGLARGGMAWPFLIVGRHAPIKAPVGSSDRAKYGSYLYLTALCAAGVVAVGW